jgi:hypothetical protein
MLRDAGVGDVPFHKARHRERHGVGNSNEGRVDVIAGANPMANAAVFVQFGGGRQHGDENGNRQDGASPVRSSMWGAQHLRIRIATGATRCQGI